jgi:hypothetical protein
VTNTTKLLLLPLLYSSQAQKDVTVNQALTQLDAVAQLSIISRTLTTPPVSPNNEDCYIVPSGATGVWSGQTNNIAIWLTMQNEWVFLPPQLGWRAWSQPDSTTVVYTSFGWTTLPASPYVVNQAITAATAALSINMANGWDVSLTVGTNITSVTVTNWPPAGQVGRLLIETTNTGPYNISGWPGTTRWPNGLAPTLTPGANARDTLLLTSSDGGSTFRGYVPAQNLL